MFDKVNKKIIDKAVKEAETKLEAVQKEIDAINREKERQLQETFKPILVQWMKDNPDVEEIMWTQYTPFWNDGEECEFDVNDIYVMLPSFKVQSSWDGSWYDPAEYECEYEDYGYYRADSDLEKGGHGDLIDPLQSLECILQSNSELLRHIFGDHAQIRVTQTEVIVEEYEDHH